MTDINKEDIREFLCKVQDFAETQIVNEPNALTERLAETGVYIAYIGYLVATCKAIVNDKKEEVWEEYKNDLFKMQSSKVKDFVSGKCKEDLFLLDWATNLESTLKTQSDEIRTLVSYAKHEIDLINQGCSQNVSFENKQNIERR